MRFLPTKVKLKHRGQNLILYETLWRLLISYCEMTLFALFFLAVENNFFVYHSETSIDNESLLFMGSLHPRKLNDLTLYINWQE